MAKANQAMIAGQPWSGNAGTVKIEGSPQDIMAALRGQGGGGARPRGVNGPVPNAPGSGGGGAFVHPQQLISQIRQQVNTCLQQNQAQFAQAQAHYAQQQQELQQLQATLKTMGKQFAQSYQGGNTLNVAAGAQPGRRRKKQQQVLQNA